MVCERQRRLALEAVYGKEGICQTNAKLKIKTGLTQKLA
jgi:hypothetical protein